MYNEKEIFKIKWEKARPIAQWYYIQEIGRIFYGYRGNKPRRMLRELEESKAC